MKLVHLVGFIVKNFITLTVKIIQRTSTHINFALQKPTASTSGQLSLGVLPQVANFYLNQTLSIIHTAELPQLNASVIHGITLYIIPDLPTIPNGDHIWFIWL